MCSVCFPSIFIGLRQLYNELLINFSDAGDSEEPAVLNTFWGYMLLVSSLLLKYISCSIAVIIECLCRNEIDFSISQAQTEIIYLFSSSEFISWNNKIL